MINTRGQIEKQIKQVIKEYNLSLTLENIKKAILEEETMEDHQRYIKMFVKDVKEKDIDKLNEICQIASDAWNNFPHKSLGGLSPMETIKNYKKGKAVQQL